MTNEVNPTKTIGILGGLGPDTTAKFYIDLVNAAKLHTRPALCAGWWSLSLDQTKEAEYIATGKHTRYYLARLLDGARRLERAGSDHIVIPCNTVHEFHARIAKSVNIPVTNLIEVVAQEVRQRGWSKVMLLATTRTIRQQLYQRALAGVNVDIRVPPENEQQKLDLLIRGLLGNQLDDANQCFLQELIVMAKTEKIILGCTDLQLVLEATETVIDSTKALVDHTARLITQNP